MIEVKAARIASGRTFSLLSSASDAMQRQGDEGIHVLLCEAYSRVSVPAGMVGLWCPLSSGIWAEALGSRFFIKRGNVYTSDLDYPHEISAPVHGVCIGVLAKHSVWCQLMSMSSKDGSVLPVVFPANDAKPVGLRLTLLQMVRRTLSSSELPGKSAAEHFGQLMVQMQEHFSLMLQRCPGSSEARRRQIFLRLQRARHLIQTSPSKNIDISRLGVLTNYSANQLIRLYGRIFGETPYSSVLRTRVELARSLIRDTNMGFSEVSRLSGFENRTSFARAFKIYSGTTASSFRIALRKTG
ncbi:AraC family transcriptional regulator [Pseudolysobacter antarcticus]|uniref:AraC family transcriptional regulator n=1 Tax=Pseudolysobacter antarcticus TaxID=2511995 RepID=A0A411HI07_9GAMM|nr:AraC family transcriptional regulator [Pseudolysobacter antarcticus]QBB70121.1 AraC family transcriptional regulator [Pseudolysobacter antarcticus]